VRAEESGGVPCKTEGSAFMGLEFCGGANGIGKTDQRGV